MSAESINRYAWLVETLTRYRRLTREQISELWAASPLSGGRPLPERTFHYYRRQIEKMMHIDILCDANRRYYIDSPDSHRGRVLRGWVLDNLSLGQTLTGSDISSDRISVEEVPSSRQFLPTVFQAMRVNDKLRFTYAGFSRSRAEADIVFHPYFLKLYHQRWYMVGLKEKEGEIRTYALDRVREMSIMKDSFQMPDGDNPAADIFDNIIGVSSSKAGVRTVIFRATRTQSKYFRALPLHHSQTEERHDDYSIFTLQVKINYELLHELLACGSAIEVLAPAELKAMMIHELESTLALYRPYEPHINPLTTE